MVENRSLDNFMQLLLAIFIFVFVLFITYLVTRWIGNYQKAKFQDCNMQVIETMRVANNKYIQIVKIASVYLVIAVCKDSITTLARLEQEDVEELQLSDEKKAESFQELFKRIKGIKK